MDRTELLVEKHVRIGHLASGVDHVVERVQSVALVAEVDGNVVAVVLRTRDALPRGKVEQPLVNGLHPVGVVLLDHDAFAEDLRLPVSDHPHPGGDMLPVLERHVQETGARRTVLLHGTRRDRDREKKPYKTPETAM